MGTSLKSWKTTLGGILLGAGTLLSKGDDWYGIVGQIMMAIGGALIGFAAKDSDK